MLGPRLVRKYAARPERTEIINSPNRVSLPGTRCAHRQAWWGRGGGGEEQTGGFSHRPLEVKFLIYKLIVFDSL